MKDFNLMVTEQGDWVIQSAKLDSNLVGVITPSELDVILSITLNQPNIKAPDKLSGWQKTLSGSLEQQQKLEVKIKLSGTLEQPKFKVTSSLESLFTRAIGAKVKEKTEKLKGKFSSAISDKVGDLGDLEQYSQSMEQWDEKLKLNDKLLSKLKVKL